MTSTYVHMRFFEFSASIYNNIIQQSPLLALTFTFIRVDRTKKSNIKKNLLIAWNHKSSSKSDLMASTDSHYSAAHSTTFFGFSTSSSTFLCHCQVLHDRAHRSPPAHKCYVIGPRFSNFVLLAKVLPSRLGHVSAGIDRK